MAREIEFTTADGHRIALLMTPNGRETILFDGEQVSSLWRPLWPGDHKFSVEEDGEDVEYTVKGFTVEAKLIEWRVTRNGVQILRAR